MRYYFSLCRTVNDVRGRLNATTLFELSHESFVAEPRVKLERLCHFLGFSAPEDYLDASAAIVFKAPRRTRFAAPWTPKLIDEVQREIASYPFLEGYSYDED